MKKSSSRSMRLRFAVLAVTATVALSSCSAVTDSSAVVTVNGTTFSRTDFELISKELVDGKQFSPDATGKISAADARNLAGVLVQYIALMQFLEKNGQSITDADRQSVIATIKPDDPYFTWSKKLQELTVNLSSVDSALARIAAPSESELKNMYENNPLSTGQLCMRHILVKTPEAARDALAQLADGADFGELAKKVSIDTAANKDGGALLSQTGSECSALADLQSSYDPDFLLGAMSAKVGVPSGPVKSSFGYHIILLRPYDEVAASLSENISKAAGGVLAGGYIATSKIAINSKYGTWNRATAKVE